MSGFYWSFERQAFKFTHATPFCFCYTRVDIALPLRDAAWDATAAAIRDRRFERLRRRTSNAPTRAYGSARSRIYQNEHSSRAMTFDI